MIELKILIDEIDYDSVADFLVPLLVEKRKKEDRTGLFGSVLSGNSAMASNMARGLLEKLPQEKKDELVVQLLTKNRDKLLETAALPPRKTASACRSAMYRQRKSDLSGKKRRAPRVSGPGFSCCHCTRSVL